MKNLDINKVYVLNPHYHLRHDIHRVVLYAGNGTEAECSSNWHTFIHPLQAVVLSFFTYNRTFGETLAQLCDFFHRDEEEIKEWLTAFVNNPTPIYTSSSQGKVYFPKRILIEAAQAGDALRFDQLNPNSFVWKKLDLTTRRLYSGPLLITLMLNNRCATHCAYCYADTKTAVASPLTTKRIMTLIEEAARMQVQQVGLIGGEVFLHKDWKKILTKLVQLNIAPTFISTKLPITPDLLQQLKETGYRGILQVSLDSCDEQVLTTLLGVPTSYKEAMLHGLQLLDESGLNYQVASVLTTHNCRFDVLKRLMDELADLKHLRDWRILPMSPSAYRERQQTIGLMPSTQQITEVFDQLRPLLCNLSFPVILGEDIVRRTYRDTEGGSRHFQGSECSALSTHLFILPDGKVTACEQLYWHPRFIVGDVTTQSLKKVWNSPEAKQLCSLSPQDIRPESPCHACTDFNDCFTYQNRCWSNIIKAYGSENWDFPDPRCAQAPELKNPLGYDH